MATTHKKRLAVAAVAALCLLVLWVLATTGGPGAQLGQLFREGVAEDAIASVQVTAVLDARRRIEQTLDYTPERKAIILDYLDDITVTKTLLPQHYREPYLSLRFLDEAGEPLCRIMVCERPAQSPLVHAEPLFGGAPVDLRHRAHFAAGRNVFSLLDDLGTAL